MNFSRLRWLALVLLPLAACHKDDKQTPLTISSFSPAAAAEGATVEITGTGFSADKSLDEVSFNGLQAQVTQATATKLTVVVPEDASSGKISVKLGAQTAQSATDFIVNPSAPLITAFSPDKGDVAVEVTLTGNHFTADSKVFFGGVEATEVTFVSKTQLKAKVPDGALNGKIKVTAGSLEGLSPADFWVRPSISAFSPDKAEEGATITLTGMNFSTVAADNHVFFGSVQATDIVSASATEIKVKVPAGAPNEALRVTVMEQEAVSENTFLLLATLSSFAPNPIERGQPLTITGKNFAANVSVMLGGAPLNITSKTATSITLTIPNDAETGSLQIRQNGATQTFSSPLQVVHYWKQINVNSPIGKQYGYNRVFAYNGKIYSVFGEYYISSWQGSPYFEVFDPATGEWSTEESIPGFVGPRRAPVITENNGNWIVGAGYNVNGAAGFHTDFWKKDPASTGNQSWTQLPDLDNVNITDNAFFYDNTIFVTRCWYSNDIVRFNHAGNSGAGSWDVAATISGFGHTGVWLTGYFNANGNIYLFSNIQGMYKFNPADNTVTGIGNAPANSFAYFSINNEGFCAAGASSDKVLYKYIPSTNSWIQFATDSWYRYEQFLSINSRLFSVDYSGDVREYIY